jgi:hypothetical protein
VVFKWEKMFESGEVRHRKSRGSQRPGPARPPRLLQKAGGQRNGTHAGPREWDDRHGANLLISEEFRALPRQLRHDSPSSWEPAATSRQAAARSRHSLVTLSKKTGHIYDIIIIIYKRDRQHFPFTVTK